MSMTSKNSTLPSPSDALAWEEFVELTGIKPEHLSEIVSLGWIDSRSGAGNVVTFRDTDIYRVRKLERICCDFELPVIGGTIIVDLLERIDRLECMVRELHNLDR